MSKHVRDLLCTVGTESITVLGQAAYIETLRTRATADVHI